MGNVFNLSKVSVVQAIPLNEKQHELVALITLEPGTVVIDAEQSNNRSFSSFMNDADFVYPQDFDLENLKNLFRAYVKTSLVECSKSNCVYLGQSQFKITKRVEIHKPLTKRYGLSDWCTYLHADLCMGKLFGFEAPNFVIHMDEEVRAQARNNVTKAFLCIRDERVYPNEFVSGPDTLLLLNADSSQ